ncbi:MAG: zinc ribbon domain-containing protein [bacterium]|nr:zinc ribbon domain-containing protein [bacterium]
MWPFKKKAEEISRTTPGFEEGERKTPKAGIVLLIIMFVAGIFFGWRALDDLSRVPGSPAVLSFCSYRYTDYGRAYPARPVIESQLTKPIGESYYYPSYAYDDSSQCQWNDLEQKHGIPALINGKRVPLENETRVISQALNTTEGRLNVNRQNTQNVERQYGLGLQELQARIEKKIFPITPDVQSRIASLINEEATLQTQLQQLNAEFERKVAQLATIDKEIGEAYRPVFAEQNSRLRWYEFKVFLLQFLLVVPLFFLILWGYLRALRKNSPYAVIFVAMLAVVGVLVLRVFLVWFWDLFLARIIEVLWQWIANFQIVRSIVFYIGMILSFVLFGGAVYYLQKKIFDLRRVTLRRFRAKQCPHCQTSLDLAGTHCPNCGAQIREKCAVCGAWRFVGLPACPNCGNKK